MSQSLNVDLSVFVISCVVHQFVHHYSPQKIVLASRPSPMVTEKNDAIIRVTSTTLCGSDLHLYHNAVPAFHGICQGDVFGHEAVGIVENVGPGVTKFKKGDRVVVSAVISCGNCEYCQQEKFSLCDRTNPSGQLEVRHSSCAYCTVQWQQSSAP